MPGVGLGPLVPPDLRCLSPAGAEVPEGSAGAVRALSARLLGLAGDPARDPDPSVYLALRLAREHDPQLEQRYLERLQDAFRHPYGRWVPAGPPWTGRLALYLLGLRATCPSPHSHRTLVTWLKYYLEEDWIGERDGHPLTTYYQYGLGMLALCVHHKRVREGVIRRLLTAQNYGKLGHHGNLVDTRAVVALAFTCLEQRRLVDTDLAAELRVAAHSVNRGLAEIQGSNGIIGNIYSTPWALQVFLATGTCQTESAFSQGMAALLENLEAFGTAATMAQVLPVLHGRSYLDIASMHCQDEPGRSQGFHTQDTPQGPFLTQVLGLEARQEKRNYWQLLTAPDTPLQMGIADYRPKDGETLILRLSEW
uniref:Transcobalamin-2 n=1 Tax=Catharus ustulatus TaxID=91951 RepID=A0A8C3Y5L7_CATUS